MLSSVRMQQERLYLEPNSLVTQQCPRCCYVSGLAGLKGSCPWMTILEWQTGPTLEPASPGGREGVSTPYCQGRISSHMLGRWQRSVSISVSHALGICFPGLTVTELTFIPFLHLFYHWFPFTSPLSSSPHMPIKPLINNLYSFQKLSPFWIICCTQISFPKILKYHGETAMPADLTRISTLDWFPASEGWRWIQFICQTYPLSCTGHMKPGWRETSLPSLSAGHCLVHHTCLSGELSSFFNAVLAVASWAWQGRGCEMGAQPQRSLQGQPKLRARCSVPYKMLVWGQPACWELQLLGTREVAMLRPTSVTHYSFRVHLRKFEGFRIARKASL